jgi:hypothetical protein
MKLILLFFLIALKLSTVNSSNQINTKKLSEKFNVVNRKISVNSERPLMLVGFWDLHRTDPFYYRIHFIKETTFPTYQFINMSINVTYKNNITEYYNISSLNYKIFNETDELEDISYVCLSQFGDKEIKAVRPSIKFIFHNGSDVLATYTEDNITKSSFADDTINNLTNYENIDINYDVFYLKKIELKGNEFTLKGNFSQSYEGKQIYLNLSGIIYNYTITNDSIKFNATKEINEHLHGKMPNSTNGTLILFYAKSGVDDSLVYPIVNDYIEAIGFGNYKKPTATANATNDLFFTGTQYALNRLKEYIRFNTTIVYKSLRILEESIQVAAFGNRTGNDTENDYVIYHITYPNTANKEIISLSSPTSFEFSSDRKTYTKSNDEIDILPNLNLTNTNNISIERMEFLGEPDTTTSNSLSFDFNISKKLSLRDDKLAYLSYIPNDCDNRTEIKCYIKNNTLPYRMVCSPKHSIIARIKKLIFYIPEVGSSSRKLRSLSEGTNRTLFPPSNASGIIEYYYNPSDGNTFSRKTTSNGLSAGAIVAIVLATVAAVVAVGVAFLLLNRVKVTPSPIKTPTDVNFANTSTNINH